MRMHIGVLYKNEINKKPVAKTTGFFQKALNTFMLIF